MSLIRIEHLRKEFPGAVPLRDVCAEIKTGDVISVIGPSGTGKSTLLRCLNLLEEPTSGTITVDDEDITDPGCEITHVRRKVGMVFQNFNLFNNLTVLENVTAAPIKLLKMQADDARREGLELLKNVGLEDKADSYPDELSGGQMQRVAIARAIAMKPEILLFDEPTSALDPTMAHEVLSIIRALARQGMTMMIVTHEMKFARDVSNRVFYMDEGGILEEGTPDEIFDHPEHEKTRQFVRRLKTLQIVIDSADFDYAGVVAKIEQYCREAVLDVTARRNLMLTFDEIVAQGILLRSGDDPDIFPIRAEAEYSGNEDSLSVTYIWGGAKFDPITEGDELAAAIITRLASEVQSSYDGKNHVRVRF